MVQLGEVRCAGNARPSGDAGKRVGATFGSVPLSIARSAPLFALAGALGVAVIATPTTARAEDATPPRADAPAPAHTDEAPPEPGPTSEVAVHERAECETHLALAETAIEHDAKYARNWTDAWYVTGGSLIALNLTNVFMEHDYRRNEAIVFGAMSTLLMIQLPTATTSATALRGIRVSGQQDPCLALASARYVLETNADDARLHTNTFAFVLPIVLNLVAGAAVAIVDRHWDFAGHGAEGLTTLVGIAAGELQTATYPRGSLRVSGTSLSMSF